MISDSKLRLLFTNQKEAEIIGKTPKDLMGKNLGEVCTDTFSVNFYHECCRAVTQQVAIGWEGLCDRFDIWLKIHAYPSSKELIVLLSRYLWLGLGADVFQELTLWCDRQRNSSN